MSDKRIKPGIRREDCGHAKSQQCGGPKNGCGSRLAEPSMKVTFEHRDPRVIKELVWFAKVRQDLPAGIDAIFKGKKMGNFSDAWAKKAIKSLLKP